MQQPLELSTDRFLAAAAGERGIAFKQLLTQLKLAVKDDQLDAAAAALRRATLPSLDYTSARSLHGVLKRVRSGTRRASPPVRLAILSGFSSKHLTELLELFLFAAGLEVEIYEADYGVFRQEILDPDSHLHAFSPKLLYLATGWRDLANRPEIGASAQQVRELVDREFEEWSRLWQTAHDTMTSQIVQNNFDLPPWRILGNHEMRHPSSLGRFISLVNQSFFEQASPYVTIHDVDHLAASAGRWSWGDERYFHHAKIPCAPEYLVDYAHSAASVISSLLGKAKKCLVLDLDNTLWGGVIGDDGLGGIRLGQGDGEAEAFQDFQRYAKGLQSRGVILAVCSKNDERTAREPFEKHSEMILRLDDISCFVANWDDKALNLRLIAEQLNIGLDSLVFVDDNPAERAIVRRFVPEVGVPEIPADPADFVRVLESHRYFQIASLGKEDLQRTDYYRANVARLQVRQSATDIDSFLASLQMVARIAPIESVTLERSTQLINKSNQFNLTTRRYSSAEVQAMAQDPGWITRTVSLADRFGDNGLISVLLARIEGDVVDIDTWLMSCRVLKRGVEDLLLNDLCAAAIGRGARTVRGEFIPTARNALAREHYQHLGFVRIRDDNEHTWWELKLVEDWKPRTHHIQEAALDGAGSR